MPDRPDYLQILLAMIKNFINHDKIRNIFGDDLNPFLFKESPLPE